MNRGTEGCGGRQEQGLGSNTPTGLAAWPEGLLPPGWVLRTVTRAGRGAEQPHGLPKDNEEKQILGLLAPGPAAGLQIRF